MSIEFKNQEVWWKIIPRQTACAHLATFQVKKCWHMLSIWKFDQNLVALTYSYFCRYFDQLVGDWTCQRLCSTMKICYISNYCWDASLIRRLNKDKRMKDTEMTSSSELCTHSHHILADGLVKLSSEIQHPTLIAAIFDGWTWFVSLTTLVSTIVRICFDVLSSHFWLDIP